MRFWHHELFPYLPDRIFKDQYRVITGAFYEWRDTGDIKDPFLRAVTEFPREEFYYYYLLYRDEYLHRYNRTLPSAFLKDFQMFAEEDIMIPDNDIFNGWMNSAYLLSCTVNLMERRRFLRGNKRLTKDEWKRVIDGYDRIVADSNLAGRHNEILAAQRLPG